MAELTIELEKRFKVLGKLGEGGMGQVLLVEEHGSGRQVALKALTSRIAMDEAAFLLFKQEFRTMSRLRHPNTCEVYDYGRLADGTPYFTMEHVPGHGLDTLLPLAPEALGDIMRQIGLALGYVHQQGFVHCDVKPENIRVRPDGTVKLMDFGLMEVAGQELSDIRGTLAYLSPEAARCGRIDARSDIYSWGAVAYHLLTGEPPFTGDSPIALLRAHLSATPRSPRGLVPAIPPALEAVVLKMLAKEPAARYPSAGEVLTALGIELDEGMGATLLAPSFVGRQAELARLSAAHQAARGQGTCQVAWVVGAAGVGKSRLLEELRFAVQLDEVPCLGGTCTEQRAPYGPFVGILRALLPLARERCPQALAEQAPWLAKLLPELAAPLADAETGPGIVLEPDQEKIVIQAAFTQLILKATAETGAVLALDHWDLADPLSVETLTYLLRNAAEAPLLVVGASRAKELVPPGCQHTAALVALDETETADMVKGMLGTESLAQSLATQLHGLTGGNPQFVANLLLHLLRTGALDKSKGRWQLPETLAADELPGDIKDLLLARLSSLSPTARGVAELAAVHGQPFGVELASTALSYEDDLLFDALDELLQAQVLESSEQQYAFADGNLRGALYERIPFERRIALHTALAEGIEARHADPAGVTLVECTTMATHFLKSPHVAKSLRYALQAATRNHDVFALDAARTLLEDGLARWDQLEGPRDWEGVRCDYLNLLATIHHWRFDLAPAEKLLAEGVPLAERLGDDRRLLELLVSQAKNASLSGSASRIAQAVKLFERAVVLADATGNARTGARARVNMGRCLFFQGQYARAREVLEPAVASAEAAGLTVWYASSLCLLGFLQVLGGPAMRAQGFARMQEAIALQERVGDRGGLGYSCNLLFEVEMQAGRLREAEAAAIRNGELAHELGIQDDVTIALLNQTIVAVEMGHLERAAAVGERCQELANRHHHKVALPIVQAVLALTAVLRGQPAKGVAEIRAAEARGRETSQYVYSIVSPYVIEIWLLLGRLQDALNAAQEAQFQLRSMDNRDAQIRLGVALAEIYGRMGQADAAQGFIDDAVKGAVDTDAKGTLVRALRVKALLQLRGGQADEARRTAEQAINLAGVVGADLLVAQLSGLRGEISALGGLSDATSYFQTMQVLADQAGSPYFRALALGGQAAAGPNADPNGRLLMDAQKTLRGLGESLDEDLRASFYAMPEVARLLERIPGLSAGAPSTPEASQHTLERLNRVSFDLQAVAAQYDMLFKEWNAKSTQLERLNDLARKINESLNFDEVLVQVVQLTLEITRAERGFLLLRDEAEPERLVCHAAFNQFGRSVQHERCSTSVCQRVLKSGQPLAIMDATADEQFQASQSIMALNLRTLMCVPLQAKGTIIGVLYVDSQAVVTTFAERDLELLAAIASHASVAIENATLHTALNRRAAELERALELYRNADLEASTDLLTGLRNRRHFEEAAAREFDVSRRYKRRMSVLMVDLDHFRQFNETYGQAVGDEALKAVAHALVTCVRTCDMAARLQDENLAVLCPDTDGPGALVAAERLRHALSAVSVPDSEGRPTRPLTVSVGAATLMGDEGGLDVLSERALASLAAAKTAGRDQCRLWG